MLALNAFTLWGVSDLLSEQSAWPWGAADMRLFCLPANVLTFLAYGLLSLRLPRLSQAKPTGLACGLLATGGVALLVACLLDAPGLPLFQLAGTLLGSGGALAFVCWEFSFAALGIREARIAILSASTLAVVPYLLLALAPSDLIVYPLALVLIPSCIALLLVGRSCARTGTPATTGTGECDDPGGGELSSDDALPPTRWKAVWQSSWMHLVCVMMIGVIGPAMGGFASLGSTSDAVRMLMYQVAGVASAGILALLWFKFKVYPSITAVFLALTPIIVLALFLFPFWTSAYQGFFLAFGCLIFSLASVLMMMACIEISHEHKAPLGVIYGLFAAGTYLAQVLGGSLAGIVSSSEFPQQFQVIAIVALLLWGISAIAFIAMRKRGALGQASGGTSDGEGEDGNMGDAGPRPDPISLRCACLSEAHALTPREAQILDLIGHGRDVAAIAAILQLSRNTIRSHIQRLYADLGVHSRQELIDLIQQER